MELRYLIILLPVLAINIRLINTLFYLCIYNCVRCPDEGGHPHRRICRIYWDKENTIIIQWISIYRYTIWRRTELYRRRETVGVFFVIKIWVLFCRCVFHRSSASHAFAKEFDSLKTSIKYKLLNIRLFPGCLVCRYYNTRFTRNIIRVKIRFE